MKTRHKGNRCVDTDEVRGTVRGISADLKVDPAGVLRGNRFKWTTTIQGMDGASVGQPLWDLSFFFKVNKSSTVRRMRSRNSARTTLRHFGFEEAIWHLFVLGRTAQQPILTQWFFHRKLDIKHVDSDRMHRRNKCRLQRQLRVFDSTY